MTTSTYLVIAYRWGWTNFSHYFVYSGQDREKAIALARAEQADRGGKYGCAVFEFEPGGEAFIMAEYAASAYDEKAPNTNRRLDELQMLGHLLESWDRDCVLLPDPDQDGYLKVTEVGPMPAWLREEMRRRETFNEQVARIHADAGLPAEAAVRPPECVAGLGGAPWEHPGAVERATDAALEAFNGSLAPESRVDGKAYRAAMRDAAQVFLRELARTMPTLPQSSVATPQPAAVPEDGAGG